PYRDGVAEQELPPARITILVAHGSRNARTAADHAALCNLVSAAADGTAVLPAFLEISEPSIGDAIDEAAAAGAAHVMVVPLFVHVGNHVERDIPAIVAEARTRHPHVEVVLAAHIGAAPGFAELIATLLDD
ncbi:MAG TPA: CbiX/SirB N-terminal domain-containing protein, partial [Microthrixaceae bacterium]|nr:CbiX/SirB N-terminal domain-containing protein [Microthrixaceae bacterium]